MKKIRSGNVAALLTSLMVFGLLCAIAGYWAIQLLAPRSPIAPVEVQADPRANLDLRSAGQLFGIAKGTASVETTAAVSNIQVVGLASAAARSSAILSVDGKPARAFAVGDDVTGGVKLVAVNADTVIIDRNGARVELPAPQRPSVAVLTSGVGKTRQGADTPLPASQVAPPPQSAVPPPPAGNMPAIPNVPTSAGTNMQPGVVSGVTAILPGVVPPAPGTIDPNVGVQPPPPLRRP